MIVTEALDGQSVNIINSINIPPGATFTKQSYVQPFKGTQFIVFPSTENVLLLFNILSLSICFFWKCNCFLFWQCYFKIRLFDWKWLFCPTFYIFYSQRKKRHHISSAHISFTYIHVAKLKLECALLMLSYTYAQFIIICKPRILNDVL